MWPFDTSNPRLAGRLADGVLRSYLSAPAPLDRTSLSDAPLLAVDIETTGFDPRSDQILAIGFVPLDGLSIDLSGAGQVLVRPNRSVGASASIHGLTDDALADALDLADAMDVVFAALTGRILLAHHARLETGFLGQACAATAGVRPRIAAVDTLALQYRLLSKGFDSEPPRGSLRLWAARSHYGLPTYGAHDALTDALGCAELYLAQVAELQADRSRSLTLKDVRKRVFVRPLG